MNGVTSVSIVRPNEINNSSNNKSSVVLSKEQPDAHTLMTSDVCTINTEIKPFYSPADKTYVKTTPICQESKKEEINKKIEVKSEEDPLALKIAETVKGGVNAIPTVADIADKVTIAASAAYKGAENMDIAAKIADIVGAGEQAAKFTGKVSNVLSPLAGFAKKMKGPLGVISVASGGYEVYKSITKEKNESKKIYGVVHGTAGAVAGGAVIAGATTVATVVGTFALGLSIGKSGDDEVKRLGFLKDGFGMSQSVSDRLGDKMWKVKEDVAQSTGSNLLGDVAAGATGIALLPGAGAIAVGGFVVGKADRVIKWISHH